PEPPVSPVVGYWHEVGRFPCDGGPEFVPEDPIRDFHISIRSFELTWRPFESYVDYIGKYTVDDERKTLTLEGLNGNYVPNDVDPSGTYEIDGDTLVLRDMWLGASKRGKGTSGCGHRFR
ncbi:hypothetical protein, partial [Enhygromyxa salina]|uniref:hypothetical protein n=1 Tax=Enhygromyxa salina TaxID=215803 RepID=UPI001C638FA5